MLDVIRFVIKLDDRFTDANGLRILLLTADEDEDEITPISILFVVLVE